MHTVGVMASADGVELLYWAVTPKGGSRPLAGRPGLDLALAAIRNFEESDVMAREWLEEVFREKRVRIPPKWSITFTPEQAELIRFGYVDDLRKASHERFPSGEEAARFATAEARRRAAAHLDSDGRRGFGPRK